MSDISLYIHIPFCRKKCGYCDFYSLTYQKDIADSYVSILCKQIKILNRDFTTIYIGGGTPSVLNIDHWKKLFTSLKKITGKTKEFTIEANPESLDDDKIKLFYGNGVNRISLGLQSLKNKKLKQLGRIHSTQDSEKALLLAKKRGFTNINADFIFGVWGESLNSWKKELKKIVKLPVTHISLYFLTYEKDTPIFREVKKRTISPLNEDIVAQMYEYNMGYLPRRGFIQYEISNSQSCIENK